MATKALDTLLHGLRQSAVGQENADLTDGDLLAAYLARRDHSAFAMIVHRHGPMVLGVCRRILHNDADAEDAFQATFLVLVRKAGAIRHKGLLGNWLYGVAHNTAIKAKAMIRRRHQKESEAGGTIQPQSSGEVWQRLQALLDAELGALSDKHRSAIVLCDLEGKTIKEAARQLGWPQGTLATRLARGRALLAKRLTGHGLTLSASALATTLPQSATAAVSPALAAGAVEAAGAFHAGAAAGVVSGHVVALAESVLSSMLLSKLRRMTVAFVIACTVALGGVLLAGFAAQPPPVKQTALNVHGGDGVPVRADDTDTVPHLRPGWRDGEKYFYSMRVEAKLEPGPSVFTEVNAYGAAARDDLSRSRDRYDLVAEAEDKDGKWKCLLVQNELPQGIEPAIPVKYLEHHGDAYLSLSVGQLSMLTALPPGPGEKTTWTVKSDCTLKESVRIDPLRRVPRKTIVHAAEETSVFTLGKRSGDLVVVHKTYSVRTRQQVDGKPYARFEGQGFITFDVKAGLARTMELNGTLYQAGVSAGIPVAVSHKLMEGEEREKLLLAREAAFAEREKALAERAKLLAERDRLRNATLKK